MKLDDVLFPAMTVRQFLLKMYDEDWNNRKKVSEGMLGATFRGSLWIQADIDVTLAKEVLDSMIAQG